MKILVAYGPSGNSGDNWNWCGPNEPVSIHGMVCASACHCGCDRSFIGIDTAKAASLAQVVEIDNSEIPGIVARLIFRVLDGWSNNRDVAMSAVRCFEQMLKDVVVFDTGTILGIKKFTDDIFQLQAAEKK